MRRSDIQGLRAVAVLLVVAFHAGLPLPGGFIGVDVFFVISGFVITGLLLRQWSASGRIDFRDFYVRRIRRLLPALALVVSVTISASLLLQSPNGAQQETAKTALGAMLISANVVIPRLVRDYFARTAGENPLLHTWSLSAEEQFYLVFPFLLAAGLMMRKRSRRLGGAALVVGIVSVLSFLSPPSFFSSIARAWEFGAGALLALVTPWIRQMRPSVLLTAGVAGLTAVIASAALVPPGMPVPASVALATIVGTAYVLASGAGPANALSRALGARVLVWIGDRSYSWYLWHWPAVVFSRLLFPHVAWVPACGAAVSLIPAAWSFRYVENPIRFAPQLVGRRLVALMSAAFVVPTALAAGLGFGARTGWGLDWALGAHVVVARNCDSVPFDPVRCRWTAPAATRTLLLVGDSQAWAIADGLIPAAASLGFDTIVDSYNACAFVAPQVGTSTLPAPPFLSPACSERNEAVLRYALTHRPHVTVIANQSMEYATAYRDLWKRSMSDAVARLRAVGSGVIVVAVAPVADERSAYVSLLRRPAGDRFTSLADQRNWRRDADAADRFVVGEHPGTLVFDPASVLCPEDRCLVAQNGTELYLDRIHLSRPGALRLETALRESLERAGAGAHGAGPVSGR